MKVHLYDKDWDLTLVRSRYIYNNSLAVLLLDEEGQPFADLTVMLEDSPLHNDDRHAYVDTNNCPWAPQFLKDSGFAEPTGMVWFSGYCMYPLYKFNIESIKEEEAWD